MKPVFSILPLCCLVATTAAIADEERYEDVMYLDEIHAKPLPVKALTSVSVTSSREQSDVIAKVQKDDMVWLVGIGESYHYIEVDTGEGPQRGWVEVEAIEAISEELRGDLEARVRKNREIKEWIAKKEVGIGMTRKQVEAVLGQPTGQKRTVDGDTVEEVWTYHTYKNLPQRDSFYVNGRRLERTYYKKVFAGGKTIVMRDDEVVSVREEQKPPSAEAPAWP